MNLIVASGLAGSLWVIAVIACPLMMIFMMRGMHGGGSSSANPPPSSRERMTLDELKHERDALNEEIGRRAERVGSTQ